MKDIGEAIFGLGLMVLAIYLIVSAIGWGAFIGIYLLIWANNIGQHNRKG
jgi:succinate dehydrogenase/fumarate reductase cytochrome b subunit